MVFRFGVCRRSGVARTSCRSALRLRHQHQLLALPRSPDADRRWFLHSAFCLLHSPSASRLEVLAKQAPANGVELELHQQALELLLVGRLHLQRVQLDRAGHVANDGRQPPGQQRLLAVGFEGLLSPGPSVRPRGPAGCPALPYWAMSFMAVFSPMPGTPGMLSDASPISASTSTTCSGPLHAPAALNLRQPQDLHPLPAPRRVCR